MITEARRLAGPFATRICGLSADGHAWREDRSDRLVGLLDEAQLAALGEVLPQQPCTAVVPLLTPTLVTWAPVPSPVLAFDVVFGASGLGSGVNTAFHQLGAYLARLHRTRVPSALADLAYGRVQPMEQRLRQSRDAARRRLAEHISAPADRAPASGEPVLTHGRFSLGVIAWGGPVPVILGWREAGPGAAAVDVDTLLSELAEAAAVAGSGPAPATALAKAFVEGYGPAARQASSDELAGRLRDRVLDHMALRAVVAGDLSGPLALLQQVEKGLDRFCAALVASPARPNGGQP